MLTLSNLFKTTTKRKTVGRGGDRGGTCGKGTKGQKARSGGYVKSQFEGGQTPLTRRIPKRGFNNYRFEINYKIITLSELDKISQELSVDKIDRIVFEQYGLIKRRTDKIKILCNGKINKKLEIIVDSCSLSAKKQIELAGGSVVINKDLKIEDQCA